MRKFSRVLLAVTLIAAMLFVPLVPAKAKAMDGAVEGNWDEAALETLYPAEAYYHETVWIGKPLMQTLEPSPGELGDVQAVPVIVAGRTYLPMRFVVENLMPAELAKTAVTWDAKTRKATFVRAAHKVEVWIGKSTILVDGVALALDTPAFITAGRTMLPLRAITEGLGATVFWDATEGKGRVDIFAARIKIKVPNIYTIVATVGAGGKIEPAGPVGVTEGEDKPFTITANSGYSVKTILVDGIAVGTGPSYTFKNVTTEHIISATFLELPPVVIPVIPSGERDRAPVIISPVIPSLTNYTVTFVDWDGTSLSTSEVNAGATAPAPGAPTRTGYTFAGWDRALTDIMAATTITATYTVLTLTSYTVTFEDYNGTTLSTQAIVSGGNATPPAEPTRTGYTFAGWDRALTDIMAATTITATYTILSLTNYTVTFVDFDGTILSTLSVNAGETAPAPSVPTRDGYTFAGWDQGLTNITAATTITATYSNNSYTLTYTAGVNGYISGPSLQTVNSGADGSEVTAGAELGYHFVNWSDASTQNPRTDLNVIIDINVTASFGIDIPNTYILTYNAGANGYISGPSPQTVNAGTAGSEVTAEPAFGYHFVSWSDLSTTNPRTDLNVTADVTVSAAFEINTFTLTYNTGANGSISGISPQTVNYGKDGIEVTAVADLGYHFTSWSDGGLTAARTDTNVKTNINVTASFELNTFALTYNVEAHGSISGTSPQTVNYGLDGAEVTAVADLGYHFGSWSDGILTAARTDLNIVRDILVTASFVIDTATLAYAAGVNGSISGTSPQTVDYSGRGSEVVAVPELGYHFVSWSDGVITASRTDANVIADINVTANFTIDTFTLTYTGGGNGTISGTTPQTVNYWTSGTSVTAVPSTGYHFVSWSDASAQNPRTDTKVTAEVTVTAAFEINTFTLTYTAGEGGTISGTTPQTVNYGLAGTEVTAVPELGYHFVSWSDGGLTALRTDINVTADVTVTAAFEINTFTLTYTTGANGAISGPSPQTVNYGASGTQVTAVPATGYYFVAWSDAVATAARTDSNVLANVTVTATFATDWTHNGAILTGYTGPGGAETIPGVLDGVTITSIGYGAFQFCAGLTSVAIPNSVASISDYAFRSCSGLTSVNIGSGVTSIGGWAFFSCTRLTSVTIPSSVTTIGNSAFGSCSGLTSVTIPASVTSFGDYAFANCSSLTSVTIPASVTSIGNGVFQSCSALTSVTIPNSVTSIGSRAFYQCNKLTSVTIPNSVTSIGDNAFAVCMALTSVTIPASVTSIGDYAFQVCTNLLVANFLGNAPTGTTNVFTGCKTGFYIHYLNTTTGWVPPTWNGFPIQTTFTIGDNYGGGKVAYIDGTGQHGLIAATANQSTGIFWHVSGTGTTGASGTALSTGNANTNAIVTLYGAESNAAKLCYDLSLNGYTDWYLPSKDELNQLWSNRVTIGGFAAYAYWSSSEAGAGVAWYQNFGGFFNQDFDPKDGTYYVRAVRSF